MSFATQFHPAAAGYAVFSFLSGYAVGPSPRELHTISAGRAVAKLAPWLLLSRRLQWRVCYTMGFGALE